MRTSHFLILLVGGLVLALCAALALRWIAAPAPRRSPRKPVPAAAALGYVGHLESRLRRAFTPGPHFRGLPPPKPGEWLAEHPERGQSYLRFVKGAFNQPTPTRRTLQMQPIGPFPAHRSPSLELLREYAAAYFQLPARVRSSLSPSRLPITTRTNPGTGKKQMLTRDILSLLRLRLAATTYAAIAVTMIDLYPDPTWNFVFGQASFRGRVGVFSFARYDPAFSGAKRGEHWKHRLLRRSMKVLVHESGHMFGMHHCVHYRCAMNGSNHLEEDDKVPLHLCPICLRKLHHAIGFDPSKRYRALQAFYRKVRLWKDARFVGRRIRWIEGRKTATRTPTSR